MKDLHSFSESHRPSILLTAFLFTLAILALGYMAFGFWTMLIFSSGFLGGLTLWLLFPSTATWRDIKVPYLVSLGLFLIHRVEEKVMEFFAALAGITGVQTPNILSWQVVLLVLASVGAWLLIPYFLKKGNEIGRYFAWTFFTALGITELAHFIFPFFLNQPYGYFPGMASVIFLAPVAWWGMYRLIKNSGRNCGRRLTNTVA